MLELIMQRSTALGSDLRAADPQGIELIQSISFDELVTVRITRPRNVKHHRLAFAVLQEVFKAQNYYATLDAMLDDIKINIGHCEKRIGKKGNVWYKPKSISFSAMDQDTFNEFYTRMMNFICTEILPRTQQADLERRVYEILGEPTPASYERR